MSSSLSPRLPPVDPADLVVLAISVVVAALAVADLVAGKKNRNALREQQARELIRAKLPAERQDFRIVSRPFVSAIVAEIVVGAVAVVLAVGFVVLLVVDDEIRQREAVMDGDVIDAGARARSS